MSLTRIRFYGFIRESLLSLEKLIVLRLDCCLEGYFDEYSFISFLSSLSKLKALEINLNSKEDSDIERFLKLNHLEELMIHGNLDYQVECLLRLSFRHALLEENSIVELEDHLEERRNFSI